MIYPPQDRVVSIFKLEDSPRTWKEIDFVGRPIYNATRYVVLVKGEVRTGAECSVFEVEHEGDGLFRRIRSAKRLTKEDETLIIRDKGLLSWSPNHIIPRAFGAARGTSARCVVILGQYDHCNIVCLEGGESWEECPEFSVKIFDTIPPTPGKMASLAKRALEEGLVEGRVPIRIDPEEFNLVEEASKLVKEEDIDAVVFSCSSEELVEAEGRLGVPVHFASQLPRSTPSTAKIGLLGCELTQKICAEHGLRGERLVIRDPCPLSRARSSTGAFLARCCLTKNLGWATATGLCIEYAATYARISNSLQEVVNRCGWGVVKG